MVNRIKDSEHMFVCGSTGSGKSVLTDVYTAGMNRVIKLDVKNDTEARRRKGEPVWQGLTENEDFEVVTSLPAVKSSQFNKIIYVPAIDEREIENYDELCRYVFEEGNCRLWIDELMLVCESALRYPKYLKHIMVAGRAFNASLVCCSQRPATIPGFILANMQHYFVFALGQPADRKRMADICGNNRMLNNPKEKYSFYYYKEGQNPETIKTYKLSL